MKAAVSKLNLFQPRDLDDALRLLRHEAPLTPLAGCTDLYVAFNFGTLKEGRFLNIWGLDELREISVRDGVLRIGALATYTQMIQDRRVQDRAPMLVAASREVGGVQIQNRGTLGGNIANASPAGDTLPVLSALDADVVLRGLDGTRRVAFNEFYTGYRTTRRQSDELIVAVDIPPVTGRQWFRKVGTRAAQAISKVVLAAVRAETPRISLGSVAPTVVRLPKTESHLASGGTIRDAQTILMDEIQPIDDVRSTAAYRKRVAANLLARFWSDTGGAG